MSVRKPYKPVPIIAKSIATGEETLFKSMQEAAEKGGFHLFSMTNCVKGLQKTHAGFTFRPLCPPRQTGEKLRPRLHELASLYNKGLTRKEIAELMGLTVGTVGKYREWAGNMGLIDEEKTASNNRPPLKRLMVVELHHQGLTNSEIASKMGISPASVKAHKAQARANDMIRD